MVNPFGKFYHDTNTQHMQRSDFIKSTAAASAFTILKTGIVFFSKANSAVNVGVIGFGNRCTAVISSLSANTNTNIIAMADLFAAAVGIPS